VYSGVFLFDLVLATFFTRVSLNVLMSDTRVKIKLIQQILYDGWFCAGEQLRSNFSFIVMKSWIIRKRS